MVTRPPDRSEREDAPGVTLSVHPFELDGTRRSGTGALDRVLELLEELSVGQFNLSIRDPLRVEISRGLKRRHEVTIFLTQD